MAKAFRTKGKGRDRKIYPIRGEPFGVSRTVAVKDVEFLRGSGRRARLIKTNRRLSLYSPYLSALEINRTEAEEKKDRERDLRQEHAPPSSAAREPSGEAPTKADIRTVWDMKKAQEKFLLEDPTILNVDGKSILTSVDQAHIMMGWKDLPAPVNSAAAEEFNGKRQALRIPALDYSHDVTEIRMGKREASDLKMLSRELVKELKVDSTTPTHKKSYFGPRDLEIAFTKPEPGKYGYAVVMLENQYKAPDSSKDYTHVMRVEMSDMPNGERASFGFTYFLDSLQLFDDIRGVKPDRNTNYMLSVKPDYPLLVSGGSPVGRKITELPEGVVLAPRMSTGNDDRIGRAIKRLTGGQ